MCACIRVMCLICIVLIMYNYCMCRYHTRNITISSTWPMNMQCAVMHTIPENWAAFPLHDVWLWLLANLIHTCCPKVIFWILLNSSEFFWILLNSSEIFWILLNSSEFCPNDVTYQSGFLSIMIGLLHTNISY